MKLPAPLEGTGLLVTRQWGESWLADLTGEDKCDSLSGGQKAGPELDSPPRLLLHANWSLLWMAGLEVLDKIDLNLFHSLTIALRYNLIKDKQLDIICSECAQADRSWLAESLKSLIILFLPVISHWFLIEGKVERIRMWGFKSLGSMSWRSFEELRMEL